VTGPRAALRESGAPPGGEQIRSLRLGNPLVRGAMRRGEEKMAGVMCGIDAVGYQAKDFDQPSRSGAPRSPPSSPRW
jgi:hypothetical protein